MLEHSHDRAPGPERGEDCEGESFEVQAGETGLHRGRPQVHSSEPRGRGLWSWPQPCWRPVPVCEQGVGAAGCCLLPAALVPVPRGDSGPQPRPLAGPSPAPGPGTAGWETVGRSQSAMRDGGPKTSPGLAAVAWSPRGETEAPTQADRSLPSPTSAAHCHRPTGPVTKASPGAGVAGRGGSRAEGGRVDTQPGPGADGSAVCPGGGRGGGLARPGEPTPSFSTSGLSGSGRRSPHTGGHPLFPRLRSVAGSRGKL